MRKRELVLILGMMVIPSILFLLLGCDQTTKGSKNGNTFEQLQQEALTKRIAASSYPLLAMAQSIAGEGYEVWMPSQADKIPSAEEIRRLQSSDVLLTNGPGAAYATWLPMVTFDRKKIFETTKDSFELSDYIRVEEHQIVHSHSGEGEHSHVWMVPHCWLNPRLALLQGEEVCDKLSVLYPEDGDSFQENYKLLESSLQEAVEDAVACQKLLNANNVSLVLSDPRLKHLARAVESDTDYLLWFEPEEIQKAKQQLQEMTAQKEQGQKTDGHHLLLWARSPGPSESELTSGLTWVQLDLIESPLAEKGFARRVKDNFKLLIDGLIMTAEIDGGVE